MGLFSTINIAATGMSAERLRTDVISNNIANASTTETQEGGPFKRSRVVLASRKDSPDFRTAYLTGFMDEGAGNGVEVKAIEVDNSPSRLVWDPTHPNAIVSGPNAGYVESFNMEYTYSNDIGAKVSNVILSDNDLRIWVDFDFSKNSVMVRPSLSFSPLSKPWITLSGLCLVKIIVPA